MCVCLSTCDISLGGVGDGLALKTCYEKLSFSSVGCRFSFVFILGSDSCWSRDEEAEIHFLFSK